MNSAQCRRGDVNALPPSLLTSGSLSTSTQVAVHHERLMHSRNTRAATCYNGWRHVSWKRSTCPRDFASSRMSVFIVHKGARNSAVLLSVIGITL